MKKKPIQTIGTPNKKGLCPKRPPLNGSKGNPMQFCKFKKGHKGNCSWDKL